MTAKAINCRGVAGGIFESHLPGDCGKIAIAHADLHALGREPLFLQLDGDLLGLFSQGRAEYPPIFGVLKKSVLTADALHFAAQIQWPVILAKSKSLQDWSERTNQRAQVPAMLLQI